MIKIKELYGYTLSYDAQRRVFVITDVDGAELAEAPTQDEAESKAKTLSKSEFKRIRIVKVTEQGKITMGELTSLNRDDNSAWISMEKGEDTWESGRHKIKLSYRQDYYEATENNLKVIETIRKERLVINQCLKVISDLREALEKPINSAYFGITR